MKHTMISAVDHQQITTNRIIHELPAQFQKEYQTSHLHSTHLSLIVLKLL